MIKVLICDDHQIVRQGIRQMLADATDIVLAAEAANGPAALKLVRDANDDASADLHFNVVLMDIAMPHRDGLDVLRQLRAEYPRLPVLMLSTYPDRQYAVRSLKLGAAGYLNKSADSETMTGAIRKVAAVACSSRRRWPSNLRERSARAVRSDPRRSDRCTSVCRTASTRCSGCSPPATRSARLPNSSPFPATPSAPTAPASWRRPAHATTSSSRCMRCGLILHFSDL